MRVVRLRLWCVGHCELRRELELEIAVEKGTNASGRCETRRGEMQGVC